MAISTNGLFNYSILKFQKEWCLMKLLRDCHPWLVLHILRTQIFREDGVKTSGMYVQDEGLGLLHKPCIFSCPSARGWVKNEANVIDKNANKL